jgi:hypothetical protein
MGNEGDQIRVRSCLETKLQRDGLEHDLRYEHLDVDARRPHV